jgi:hypothetical protein
MQRVSYCTMKKICLVLDVEGMIMSTQMISDRMFVILHHDSFIESGKLGMTLRGAVPM